MDGTAKAGTLACYSCVRSPHTRYRHLEHEEIEKSKKLEVTQTHLLTPRTTYSGVGMHVLLSSKLKTAPLGQDNGVFQPPRGVVFSAVVE